MCAEIGGRQRRVVGQHRRVALQRDAAQFQHVAAPGDVERAFTAANPSLRPGMLAAVCRHGTLDEVRVCFTRDLRAFQACPEVAHEGCRDALLSVPAVR